MSDQYEEDKPWHLTQEPDEVPCYEDLETRIEELEAENHLLKTSGIAEVAVKNSSVMEYMQHWEGRAEAAEAKLAKAVKGIRTARGFYQVTHIHAALDAILAELTGDKDE